MAKRKHTPEETINKLREAEVIIAWGSTVAEAARRIGVSEQTFYRWRSEYGGLRVDQARCLKQLETENGRLKRAVAELTSGQPDSQGGLGGKLLIRPAAAFVSSRSWRSSQYRSGGAATCWDSPAPPSVMRRWSQTTSRP